VYVSWSDGGRVFHTKGPATEIARWTSLVRVRTVVAALVLVVADRRRRLLESTLTKCILDGRDMSDKLLSSCSFSVSYFYLLFLVSEMTYYMSSGTLNPTHSLIFLFRLRWLCFFVWSSSYILALRYSKQVMTELTVQADYH